MSMRIRAPERTTTPDQRRTKDRRAATREGEGGARGRRATDVADARALTAAQAAPAPTRKRRATRDGREPLVVYLRPESIKALKIAALENDTTASAIVGESVESWLRANGRPPRRQG